MSDDTNSEVMECNEKEKISSLRKLLGPKEIYGSSMGLAFDLQSERTRFVEDKTQTFEERMRSRPPEFTESEWLALSRTTRYPDNSTLAGSRICKAFYEYYRLDKTLCELLKADINKFATSKVHVQTILSELCEYGVDHPEFYALSKLLSEMYKSYDYSKNAVKNTEKIKQDGICWAFNTFLNIKKVKEVLDHRTVTTFLHDTSKNNLMKIVMASLHVHEENQNKIDRFYGINSFKRNHEDLYTSESQDESEESEENNGNSERIVKKPKRNENEFLEQIKELGFMCPGVPGRRCRLRGIRLDKEDFDCDHIRPWKYSKDDSRKNKRPLCMSCHRWKTNNIDKYLKDDYEAIQLMQNENILPDRLMTKILAPHCTPCDSTGNTL